MTKSGVVHVKGIQAKELAIMAKPSRRAIMATMLASPLVGVPDLAASSSRIAAVPVVAHVDLWLAQHAELERMEDQWHVLEGALFDRAAALKISVVRAEKRKLPEARALRSMGRRIRGTLKRLESEAARISDLRATSVEGAIAKIDLGLRVQGPFDWRPSALELLEDGLAELRRFIR